MKVTNTRLINAGAIKAFLDVTTEEGILLKGYRVVDGKNGLWVGWPQEKKVDKNTGQTEYFSVVVTDEEKDDCPIRDSVNKLILEAYTVEVNKVGGGGGSYGGGQQQNSRPDPSGDWD